MSFSDPISKVLNEDMLREKILDYVILNDYQASASNIRACRLVRKAWLFTISKLFRKSQKPLFFIHLNKQNSIHHASYVKQRGKLLQQFLTAVLESSRMDERVPPFQLVATADFFLEENYSTFMKCLRDCGGSLIKLKLSFPKDGGSMPMTFPIFSFPALKNFIVKFCDDSEPNLRAPPVPVTYNANVAYLMQSIFHGARHLKTFDVPVGADNDYFPFGFEYLILPTTITKLTISCQMESKHLELLVRNTFPQLRDLVLLIPDNKFSDGMVFKVLDNVRTTLVSFVLGGMVHDATSRLPTLFRFPLMEQLEIVIIRSTHFELESDIPPIQESLPKLKVLDLKYQTSSMLHKWVKSSRFESVEKFETSLIDYDSGGDAYVNFDVETIQSIHLAFPNIKELELTLCGTEISGLQYVFLEMQKLELLSIRVKKCEELVNSDFWDSLLIGIPVEWATALRTTPTFWHGLEFKDNILPSIKNLTSLRELQLHSEHFTDPLKNFTLISDAVFHFAFLKMACLQTLTFGGKFLASSIMKQKWRQAGRSIPRATRKFKLCE